MTRELDAILHFGFLCFAIICWLFNKKRKTLVYLKYTGVFLFTTFLFDGAAVAIMFNQYLAIKIGSNLFLYHFLIPIQFIILMLLYRNVILSEGYRKVLLILIFAFAVISIFISVKIQTLNFYNAYTALLKHFIIVLVVLAYFYELLIKTPYERITEQTVFWISIGLLFHATVNILLEGVSNYLSTYSKENYDVIYLLYSVSNYLLFLLIGFGLLMPNNNKLNLLTNESF